MFIWHELPYDYDITKAINTKHEARIDKGLITRRRNRQTRLGVFYCRQKGFKLRLMRISLGTYVTTIHPAGGNF